MWIQFNEGFLHMCACVCKFVILLLGCVVSHSLHIFCLPQVVSQNMKLSFSATADVLLHGSVELTLLN